MPFDRCCFNLCTHNHKHYERVAVVVSIPLLKIGSRRSVVVCDQGKVEVKLVVIVLSCKFGPS